ncbi:hypothetical protein RTG_00607 [Rhodotorula toruloides ATCC 204091]|uniref:Uncharacterized protein n=1 Tax=Rhodotorula toruloides TaxID=5286 RepID=A0A0K3CP53_RHOTO|nr:hypothetical protein RTG_00607 [Rhodotorula toruloides ATCC 204091]
MTRPSRRPPPDPQSRHSSRLRLPSASLNRAIVRFHTSQPIQQRAYTGESSEIGEVGGSKSSSAGEGDEGYAGGAGGCGGGLASRIAQNAAQTATSAASSLASRFPSTSPSSRLSPTYDDVLEVLALLQDDLHLPPELAVQIVDAADYYASFVSSWEGEVTVSAGPAGHRQNADLLQTPPIPAFPGAAEHAVRRIRVTTVSRDQGFTSFSQYRGTREASSSWFELEIRRPRAHQVPPDGSPASSESLIQQPHASSSSSSTNDSSPPDPPPNSANVYGTISTLRLHSNIHGHYAFTTHSLTLSDLPSSPDRAAAAFVRQIREGDRLVVVACAMYPLWENVVRGCAVEVEMMVV